MWSGGVTPEDDFYPMVRDGKIVLHKGTKIAQLEAPRCVVLGSGERIEEAAAPPKPKPHRIIGCRP